MRRRIQVLSEVLGAPEDVRQNVAAEGLGKLPLDARPEAALEGTDPEKGCWGGSPTANDRILEAKVTPAGASGEWFKIELTVRSLKPTEHPLVGNVTFHLHPTFKQRVVTEAVGPDGVARLERFAYGAFTVGAECDNGQTKLELDLAKLPDAPPKFRER
jgi:hypothetical protein